MKYVVTLLVALTLNSFCVAEHILIAHDAVVPLAIPSPTINTTPAVSDTLHSVVHGEIPTRFRFDLIMLDDIRDISIVISGDAWVVGVNGVAVVSSGLPSPYLPILEDYGLDPDVVVGPVLPVPVLQMNGIGAINEDAELFVFGVKRRGQAVPSPSTLGMFVISAVPLFYGSKWYNPNDKTRIDRTGRVCI